MKKIGQSGQSLPILANPDPSIPFLVGALQRCGNNHRILALVSDLYNIYIFTLYHTTVWHLNMWKDGDTVLACFLGNWVFSCASKLYRVVHRNYSHYYDL